MIVVANAGPLIALAQIGQLHILPPTTILILHSTFDTTSCQKEPNACSCSPSCC
jgi:hypothetical protein